MTAETQTDIGWGYTINFYWLFHPLRFIRQRLHRSPMTGGKSQPAHP